MYHLSLETPLKLQKRPRRAIASPNFIHLSLPSVPPWLQQREAQPKWLFPAQSPGPDAEGGWGYIITQGQSPVDLFPAITL